MAEMEQSDDEVVLCAILCTGTIPSLKTGLRTIHEVGALSMSAECAAPVIRSAADPVAMRCGPKDFTSR